MNVGVIIGLIIVCLAIGIPGLIMIGCGIVYYVKLVWQAAIEAIEDTFL